MEKNNLEINDRTQRYFGTAYEQIKNEKVLVIGAGAVGSEVVKNLVMLGIGTIYLVDFDLVSMSNLNRCVFFRPEDHEKTYKVHAIQREVQKIWKHVNIIPYPMSLENAPEEIWDVPLVILAVDNNEARYYANILLLSLDNPPFVINGAMGRNFVEIQTLLPKETACLLCTWSQSYKDALLKKIIRESCSDFFEKTVEKFPSISVLNSILGGIISSEAVKILLGYKMWQETKQWQKEQEPFLGKMWRYNIQNHEFILAPIHKNPACIEVLCK
ncbi:MAG: ThiF family adenylyltransferase [Planctomycetes bacterium]|nr:ThiF family adenylyltransferase [Planctomycetota bacterium]HNZ65838.1 ThiF family adenylyltransferase [Planctomycetota bacterium]HPY75858.1 ThiF family adenylyltransferase [Planctomycetota bacterium]HQB01439.1 ThiF family adenylyltransferase [Planctomycetota bacterium]